jgi:CheY-like chemotaxis protein
VPDLPAGQGAANTAFVKNRQEQRILVVEDNLLNQKLAGFMLSDWGFQYDICSNGKLAIHQIQQVPYDLVLMDIQMPELNGYETTQVIREELKLALPIIAMTAHALPDEKEKCLACGMTDYLAKPIQENTLLNLLNTHL